MLGERLGVEVRVPVEARLVEAQQLPRLLQGDLPGPHRALDILAQSGGQLVGRVLHVVQYLAHRFALDNRLATPQAITDNFYKTLGRR